MAELAGQEVHSLAGLVQHLDLMVECRVEHFQAVELVVAEAQDLPEHADGEGKGIMSSQRPS